MQTAYVICYNDGIDSVVLDNGEKAIEIMEKRQKEYYDKFQWNFKSFEEYEKQVYWHLHKVKYEK
jgi:hypothetical protein